MGRPNEIELAKQQVAILSILGSEQEVPLAEIAQRLGLSNEQARSQIDTLACCNPSTAHSQGLDIYTDEERGTVVVWRAMPEFKNSVRLTGSEARAIDSALDLAGIGVTSDLREKLSKAAIAPSVDYGELVRNFCAVEHGVNAKTLGIIALAIEQQHLVSFKHRNASSGEVKERLVEPYNLVYGNSTWYLEGFCQSAKDLRTFRVDGMAEVQDAGAYPERSYETAAPASTPSTDGLPHALVEVDVRLVLGHYCDWPGTMVVLNDDEDPLEDGTIALSVPYRGTAWLAHRIASLGDGAEVVNPPELASQSQAEAAAILARAQKVWDEEGVVV